jgi:uncharacterized protein
MANPAPRKASDGLTTGVVRRIQFGMALVDGLPGVSVPVRSPSESPGKMFTVLDDNMKRVVREQRLGYVATVCPDGTPNLSPKGTTTVWDDQHLVFLDLHSPGTVANIEAGNPVVEVNVVDPLRRKGYRFKGPAEVYREGPLFEDVVRLYARERAIERRRINAVVLVRVVRAAPLVSPAYADGSSEETIEQRSLDMYGLMRKSTGER